MAALLAVFDPFVTGKIRRLDSAVIGKFHRVVVDVYEDLTQGIHGFRVLSGINKFDRADTIRLGVEK